MKRILFTAFALSCLLAFSSCKRQSAPAVAGSDEELLEDAALGMDMFEDASGEDAVEEEVPEENAEDTAENEEFEENMPLSYSEVDTKPVFESKSDTTFRDWIAERIQYPEKAVGNGKSGTVMAQFTVDTLGKVSDIKILRSVDPALDSEVIRVLASSPDWKSASHEDSLVAVSYVIPVKFTAPKKKIRRK